ncbi:MAG: dihydroorotate dehydrogenase (quinone) [Acidobacteriota bacterium]
MLYRFAKPLLFRLDAEQAHDLGKQLLRASAWGPARHWRRINRPPAPLGQTLLGLKFASPIGLAAGFDKDGEVISALPSLGFGFAEVGTVTPRPQEGNPRPRLFRHRSERSLQNRLGFNNQGMDALRRRLEDLGSFPFPIGVNIGKNKNTAEDQAIDDYRQLLRAFGDLADYLVINVSSPNTPGLRDLQSEAFLRPLLHEAREITEQPVLVKIAPDMEPQQAVDLCAMVVEAGAAGIVGTNTTSRLDRVAEPIPGGGGLSGRVLTEASFEIFQAIARELFGKALLISVGGIDSASEIYRRLRAGASLVQIYTALVYGGPTLLGELHRGLVELLEEDGFENLGEAIGADWR